MPTEAYNLIIQGRLVESILAVYTEPMGFWFFLLMYSMIVLMVYLKTESVITPLLVSLMLNGIIMALAPAGTQGVSLLLSISQVLFAISAAGVIYKMYKGS
jgi:hypothetical protein